MAIRVALADDHPIVLDGLAGILTAEEGFEVVARCRNGQEALEAAHRHRPDILVVDLAMPVKDGLTVLREIRSQKLPTAAVVLTASLDEDDMIEAVQAGARGFVVKELAPELIVQCLRTVHAGEPWLEHGVLVRATEKMARRDAGSRAASRVLTPRELDIVRMVGAGLRNRAIAESLSITEGTVKVHRHNIYEKLGIDGRLALLLYAQEQGLL